MKVSELKTALENLGYAKVSTKITKGKPEGSYGEDDSFVTITAVLDKKNVTAHYSENVLAAAIVEVVLPTVDRLLKSSVSE